MTLKSDAKVDDRNKGNELNLTKDYKLNMRHIILICAKRGHGKDECAKYLIKHHNFLRCAFADQLKDEVSKKYFIPRYALDDVVIKEQFRPLLQEYGSKKKADYGEDVWIMQIISKIKALPPTQNVVITDWRFKNELEKVKAILLNNMNGNSIKTIKIHAKNKPIMTTSVCDNHISETELDDVQVDYNIQNEWNNTEQTHLQLRTALKL